MTHTRAATKAATPAKTPASTRTRPAARSGIGRATMTQAQPSNQAVLLRARGVALGSDAVQVSHPGDHHELEAGRMAEAALSRRAHDRKAPAQSARQPIAVRPSQPAPGGRSLPPSVRTELEPAFQRDFSAVRVFDEPADRRLTRHFAARAFTQGGHIWLGDGQRADDMLLMAHELAHVVQQTAGPLGRDALIQRQPDPNQGVNQSGPIQAAPTPSVAADNPLVDAMSLFASIKPSSTASGIYEGVHKGKRFELSQAQYDQLKLQVRAEALKAWRHASSRAETALGRYQEQQKVDAHHWFVAPIVKAFGRVSDPGPALIAFVMNARASLVAAKVELDAGNYVAAAELIGEGERSAEQASKMVLAYVDQIIDTTGMTVTVLQGVQTASTVILFLCAVAATGGAAGAGATALGLEGVGGTTTILGVTGSTATWATVVGTGAAITSEVGVGIVRAADGEKVDWGEIAVHAAVQVVIAKFSPTLGQRLSKSLGSAAAYNKVIREALARVGLARVVTIATNLLMHEGSQLFATIVDDTIRALRGKPITWGDFGEHLFNRLLDPKGLFMAALAGALGGTHPEPSREPAGPPKPSNPNAVTKSKTDNNDWRSVNREVGISKPRTKATTPPSPPPGFKQITAEEAFQPTAAERAQAFAKEGTPLATDGTPIKVSPGASPKGQQFQSASMTDPSRFAQTISADVGESTATKAVLDAGEILLESPQGTNVSKRADLISATRDATGKMWVIANDAKTRTSSNSSFPDPESGLRPGWNEQVKAAVDRAAQSDPQLGAELKAALAAGRVWVRQINVDRSPLAGGVDLKANPLGAVSGVAPPTPVGWSALLPPASFDDEKQ